MDASPAWHRHISEDSRKMVAAMARRYAVRDEVLFEELVSAGYLGLVKAARRYNADHGSGASFVTYGHDWVERQMLRHLGREAHGSHAKRWQSLESLAYPDMLPGKDRASPMRQAVNRDLLARALVMMNAGMGRVFLMRYRDGMAFKEIALAVGASVPWLKLNLAREIRRVRRLLQSAYQG